MLFRSPHSPPPLPLLSLSSLSILSPFSPSLQFDVAQLMVCVNVTAGPSPPRSADGPGVVEGSPVDRSKGFFPDESEPLLRCDSTSSKDSALSRTGSFITKGWSHDQDWSHDQGCHMTTQLKSDLFVILQDERISTAL